MSDRVMEVLYTKEKYMYYDIIKEYKWNKIVNAFFIEGSLEIPQDLAQKEIRELTDNDYKKFFEELDYIVIGISDYDPNIHQEKKVGKIDPDLFTKT
ncbi:hypothetical protein CL621_00975 [archaeon]|nr:hypothetical protein [archaeon]|tara:strand:+ start:1394 stop:1684 length:291 start_codon:yes stop_codon:yes gene_type:complete